jgi:hypothetical protein
MDDAMTKGSVAGGLLPGEDEDSDEVVLRRRH